MSVLYRKYRPQTFADVVGQAHVTRTISAAILGGRVAHAYLLTGPRGVGKTTTARLLAKAVNCERRRASADRSHPERPRAKRGGVEGSPATSTQGEQGVPCNQCRFCTEITEGRCMDVVEIDAASHTGVDHVREHIIEAVRFAPAQAQRKVFIIDEVHMLSGGAFNALLKTIEEPPDHALFILATTEFHKVPETIRSRCQVFAFRRVAHGDLTARLRHLVAAEGVTVEESVFDAIVRTADGSVRDAESMLGQLLALGGKTISAADAALVLPRSSIEHAEALLQAIVRCDVTAALAEVRFAEEEGFDAEAYVRDVIAVLRNAIVAEPGHAAGIAGRVTALRVFASLMETIGRSDRPFFALEVGVLGLVVESRSNFSPSHREGERPVPRSLGEVGEGEGDSRDPSSQTRDRLRGGVPSPPAKDFSPASPISQGRGEAIKNDSSPSFRGERLSASGGRGGGEQNIREGHEGAGDPAALTRIRAAWTSLPATLTDVNGSLPYLLEGGRPQRVGDGVLTIGFRYKLHAEKVRQPNVLDAVAHAVSEVAGTPLRIVTAVIGQEEFAALDAAVRPQTGDAVADAALEVFGGRVVE